MPTFRFMAFDAAGKTVRGELVADTANAANMELDQRGLIPLRCKPVQSFADVWNARRGGARWTIENKVIFTRKFSSLLNAGIPLLKVLDLIAGQTTDTRVAAVLRRVAELVENGLPLHEAMSRFPGLFDRVYLGAVRTGEATGRLDSVLEQTASFLEREMNTQRKVKEAIRYPIMVIIAIVLAAIVCLKFVVPEFMAFYTNFGGELPAPTRILMTISELTGRLWWLIVPAGFAAWAGWWWTTTPVGRAWRDRWLLRLPLLGPLLTKVSVCRFARLFGILYSAGVPATSALETIAPGVGNVIVAAEVSSMKERLSAGKNIGEIPDESVIPELVYQMIDIGFESGEVERMLGEAARHYEQEIEYDVRRLTDRLQPFLLLFLAAGVVFLALAVLLPMWNLISIFR